MTLGDVSRFGKTTLYSHVQLSGDDGDGMISRVTYVRRKKKREKQIEESARKAHHETVALISEHSGLAMRAAEGSPEEHKVMAEVGYYNTMHKAKKSRSFYQGTEEETLKSLNAASDVHSSGDPIIHFGKEVQNINLGASVIHLVGGGHKEAGRALVMQAQQAFGIVN